MEMCIAVCYCATLLAAVAWHYTDKRFQEKPPLLQQLLGARERGDD